MTGKIRKTCGQSDKSNADFVDVNRSPDTTQPFLNNGVHVESRKSLSCGDVESRGTIQDDFQSGGVIQKTANQGDDASLAEELRANGLGSNNRVFARTSNNNMASKTDSEIPEASTEMPQKKLLVLDVNGLLLNTYHDRRPLPNQSPDGKAGDFYGTFQLQITY